MRFGKQLLQPLDSGIGKNGIPHPVHPSDQNTIDLFQIISNPLPFKFHKLLHSSFKVNYFDFSVWSCEALKNSILFVSPVKTGGPGYWSLLKTLVGCLHAVIDKTSFAALKTSPTVISCRQVSFLQERFRQGLQPTSFLTFL